MTDPFLTLGIEPDAEDATVEAAYRAAIKRCPPERDAAAFQALREAYERVRTRDDRIAYRLFDTEPPAAIDIIRQAATHGSNADAADPAVSQAASRPTPALFAALLRGED
ncbi:MAG: molecular chaperone DnaJ [Halochromatium sp.]|nr:molecular chaperone DnaJ [Halochromatium sp.]